MSTKTTPHPTLDQIISDIGQTGQRMSEIDACEGAAGNISVFAGFPLDLSSRFPHTTQVTLPTPAPELAGAAFVVSGSGCRLRDIGHNPATNLGAIVVNPDGETGQLHTGANPAFSRVTSEFNSHFTVHREQVRRAGLKFHAIVHAQPLHITYLSHIERYQDQDYFNQHLLRWQPELIINLPHGAGVTKFQIPGSQALMEVTLEKFDRHNLIVWCKHGLIARSEHSACQAGDLIDYAEVAAHYEYMNLTNGGLSTGLSPEEIRSIAKMLDLQQTVF